MPCGPGSPGRPGALTAALTPTSGTRSVSSQPRPATRQRPRSPSAPVAPYGPSAWSCRCGTGTSASTVSGAAWSQRTARTCAAGGPQYQLSRNAGRAGRPPREEESMSSAVGAHPPGGLHREPELTSSKDQQKARALGLTSATGLVTGTVIGAGVFTMPAVLAGAGTVSLAVLAVIAVGAMVLAVLFGQLTRRVPNSDGGLYAYARHEFGDFAGYLTGWCYWIQAWAGNAAIVSSWVFYVDALFGIKPSGLGNWGIALIGLWIPAVINLAGVKQMAWLQNVTVVLKYLPLLFVAVVGWFFVAKANFGAFNASGGSLYSAIGIAAGVALFSFIGVETAAIAAKRVKDPRRNVGRASLLGTAASPILYLAVSAVIIGLVPHHALVHSTAPFVLAFGTIFTHGAWAVHDERQARVLAASQHWEIRQDGTG